MKKLLTITALLPLVAMAEMGHDTHHMHETDNVHVMPEMMVMTHEMVMPMEPMPMMTPPPLPMELEMKAPTMPVMPMHDMHMMMPSVMPNMPISTQLFLQANHDMHMGMNIEYTGTPDIDFLRGMIPHHQGAVDMANIVLEHGTNGNAKNLARRIINAQEREMRLMRLWLNRIETNHGTHIHENAPSTAEFQMQNMVMHEDMNIEFSGNADIDFVRGMIPHHQGAVEMAQTVLEYGTDANVRRFAADVIADQTREINEMNRWLRRLQIRKIYQIYPQY